MEFAVCDYAHRPFEHVCADLQHDQGAVLQAATNRLGSGLRVQGGPLVMVGSAMAELRASWRNDDGIWLVGDLRVVPVNRGIDPVTEVLLIGEQVAPESDPPSIIRWARHLLAELTDRPSAMQDPSDPDDLYSRILVSELVRHRG